MPPAVISAGTSTKNPQGIDVLTLTTNASEPKSSANSVESQNVEIVSNAIAPINLWCDIPQPKRTPGGDALTGLVLDLFRLNNQLLSAGDRLVAPLGLTSARWQILGAIAAADYPQPVAWLARNLGAHRQNVQRIINDLAKEGLVGF